VSSAAPAGRINLALFSLTAHVRGLLTVAGDELRKTVATRPTGFFVPTAQQQLKPLGFRILESGVR